MSASSKVRDIQSVRIQPEDWLAATTELNLRKNMMMGCYEANEAGYWEGAHSNIGVNTPKEVKIMAIERELRNLTEKYLSGEQNVEWYVQELLPKELDYLRDQGRMPAEPAEILVQLVGYSWEPLLISICAYRPEALVPILNEEYGEEEGKARGDEFKEIIGKLKDQNLIDDIPEILPQPWETVKDKPKDVFKFLKKHVLPSVNEGRGVVVDITGAKKSMVSGAYLFSSYTNATVVYVNYDEYNKKYGKPYGYTCELDKLRNPIELFKLRDWDRVRQLYEHYAFRRARELTKDIKAGTESFFEAEELKSIDVIMKWLEFYRLWDEGDYSGSREKGDDIFGEAGGKIPDGYCPTAVAKLSEIWPNKDDFKELKSGFGEIEGSLKGIEKSIYIKDEEILVYACDELEKIKRLIKYNEDYRSALLRAAGLNEVLLKARVVRSWMQNKFVVDVGEEQLSREDIKNHDEYNTYLPEIDRELLGVGATYLHMALRWEKGKGDKYAITLFKLKEFGDPAKAHRSVDGSILNKFWKSLKKPEGFALPDDVFNYRNKAIHFCLSIPKEISEVAVNLAEKNLEDFQENWINVTLANGNYETMNWNELCDVCNIKFLPKQREEQK